MKIYNYLLVNLLASIRSLLLFSNDTMKLMFIPGFEKARWNIGKRKAYVEFLRAKKNVPAYKDFLIKNNFLKVTFNGTIPDINAIPISDKDNYIRKYSLDERCVGGQIPSRGVIIDESSGSTGMPVHWVRGIKERRMNKRMLEFGLAQLIGKEPQFIINAFALGPWASGINITMSFSEVAIVKSLGPDIQKIENTFSFFGNKHNYLVMGYPPFLKTMVDTAKVKWNVYNVTCICGGEGISEPMRNYILSKGIKKLYSGLGASDLELNIAAENDFTIALRKYLEKNKTLSSRLIKHKGAMPMIFQYNPLDFFMETNSEGELLVTVCRPGYASPKIRYNIHDTGHVIRMPEFKKLLKELNIDIKEIGVPKGDVPLLFHYGRSDLAVAFFGAKIAPPDMQEVVFRIPELANNISSFTMLSYEDEFLNRHLTICFELLENRDLTEFTPEKFNEVVFNELKNVNQDFREALKMAPDVSKPTVEFYASGTGPFSDKDIRLKSKYIKKN